MDEALVTLLPSKHMSKHLTGNDKRHLSDEEGQAHHLDVVVKKANNNGISWYETNKMPSHSTFSHIPTTQDRVWN